MFLFYVVSTVKWRNPAEVPKTIIYLVLHLKLGRGIFDYCFPTTHESKQQMSRGGSFQKQNLCNSRDSSSLNQKSPYPTVACVHFSWVSLEARTEYAEIHCLLGTQELLKVGTEGFSSYGGMKSDRLIILFMYQHLSLPVADIK